MSRDLSTDPRHEHADDELEPTEWVHGCEYCGADVVVLCVDPGDEEFVCDRCADARDGDDSYTDAVDSYDRTDYEAGDHRPAGDDSEAA